MTLDVLKLWIVQDDGTYVGKNQLVKLALRVHSAVANSADCERFFSRMGAIHTKSRNRLDPQVVRNLAVVKMAIQEEFKKDALINRKRKREEFEELHTPKRSLSSKPPAPISNPAAAASTSAGPSVAIAHPDEAEEADADEANGGNETPMSTRELVTALTTAADGDDIADDTESFDVRLLDASIMERITGMTPSPSPAPVASPAAIHAPSPGSDGQPRHYFGTQQVCPIGDLFDFSDKKMEMWDSIGRHGEVWYSREEVELENRSRASTAEIEDIDTSTLHKPVKMEP